MTGSWRFVWPEKPAERVTAFWSAPAKSRPFRDDDGALDRWSIQSAVAPDKSGLPAHSKSVVRSAHFFHLVN